MSTFNNIFTKIRFVIVAIAMIVCGANGAMAACSSNQIDVTGNGTQCEPVKFSVTTTSDATSLSWTMTATGPFYVDCGDGGNLTQDTASYGTLSGKTINRTGTSATTYTCAWDSAGEHTVRFGGTATGYGTGTYDGAISFYKYSGGTQAKVASIDGSLGAMFPVVNGNIPRFYQTFYGCTNLTQIPAGLFSGIDTSSATDTSNMFYSTFFGCTNLTQIPATLFSGLNTSSATDTSKMFGDTFYGCNNITQIPAGLFSAVNTSSATNTNHMFQETFYKTKITSIPATLFSAIDTSSATYTSSMFKGTFNYCSNLTQIPATLFSAIDTSSATDTSYMFGYTFSSTKITSIPDGLFDSVNTSKSTNTSYMFSSTFSSTKITSIPDGLFDSVNTSKSKNTSSMFGSTFRNCYNLTQIPAGLFDSIDTSSATNTYQMFLATFASCTNLTGYIPPTAFPSTIRPGTSDSSYMWNQTFSATDLATTCPAGTTEYNSGFQNYWNYSNSNTTTAGTYRVSCEPCAGTLPENAIYTTAGTCDWTCNTGYELNTDTGMCEVSCAAGYYKNGDTCTKCAAGTYSAAGATQCTTCTNTKPTNSSYSSGATTSSCPWTCNAGYYKNGDTCTACAAGTYSAAGATQCTTCTNTKPANSSYSSGATTSSCPWICNAGYYKNGNTCTKCAAGTYSAAGATQCTTCAAGTYSAAGAASCTTCTNTKPTNSSYSSGATTSSCPWTCNAGYYKSSTSCYSVGTGYYSPAGDNSRYACTNAPAHTFYEYSSKLSTNSCPWACNAGYYKNGDTCTVCPAGTYRSRYGASSCTACPAGTYSAAGAGSCTTCAAGTYSAAGATQCTTCANTKPANSSYSNGATTSSCPWTCDAEYYSSDGSTCTSVGTGYYSPAADNSRYECTNAPANSTYTGSATTNSCPWACNAEYYSANGTTCTSVGAGYYSVAGSNERTACTNAPANATYTGSAATNSCPWACDASYTKYNNACHGLCPVGNALFHAGEHSYPLFADKTNVPSPIIHIRRDANTVCYVYMEPGMGDEHGLKMRFTDGNIYHAIDPR